jgi:hypothetical protein
MTAETLAVNADGSMVCGADRGDRLACYATGKVAPSSYEPAEPSSGADAPSGGPSGPTPSPKPVPAPSADKHPGKLLGRAGSTLTVELASTGGIAKGTRGTLQKRFQRQLGSITASGWLQIATVTVVGMKGSVAQLRIDEESSVIIENGRKVNHFTPGSQVQLIVEP